MYLIVDSGSTKTDWFAIDEKGTILFSTQTLGLNPQVLSDINLDFLFLNQDSLVSKKIISKTYALMLTTTVPSED